MKIVEASVVNNAPVTCSKLYTGAVVTIVCDPGALFLGQQCVYLVAGYYNNNNTAVLYNLTVGNVYGIISQDDEHTLFSHVPAGTRFTMEVE